MSNLSADPDTTKKFLFEQEYDTQDDGDLPSITRLELEAQVKMAFKEGYQKGVDDTNQDIQRQAEETLKVLIVKMEGMIATEAAVVQSFHDEVAQICEVVATQLFPVLARHDAFLEVQNLLQRSLENRPQVHEAQVEVHPDILAPMQAHLKKLEESLPVKTSLHLKTNAALHQTDCQITWQNGGVERYIDKTLQEVSAVLEKLATKKLRLEPADNATPASDGDAPEVAQPVESPAAEAPAPAVDVSGIAQKIMARKQAEASGEATMPPQAPENPHE